MKYHNCEWWIEAEGYYGGYLEETLVFKQGDEIVILPEEFQGKLNRLIEERPSVGGLPKPPKGSYAQVYHIMEDCFFDGMAEKIEGEGHTPKWFWSEPNMIY